VWSIVADANGYSQWGPWQDGGYRPPAAGPSQEGSVQWFRYGRRTVTVEEILKIERPRRLAYRVVHGIPVRNYRAEVVLTPTRGKGTTIRWSAAWDDTLLGRIVHRKLRQLYPQIVQALVTEGDQSAARASALPGGGTP
jgi:uncharacterized protein YndB with AHSA1/START domain